MALSKKALWCNLCRASPALLRASELTDNICTASWLFGEWKHTSFSYPGCLVGLGYRGWRWEKKKKKSKEAVEVSQARQQWGQLESVQTGLHVLEATSRPVCISKQVIKNLLSSAVSPPTVFSYRQMSTRSILGTCSVQNTAFPD